MLFLLAWFSQPKEEPKEEAAVEISMFAAPLRRQHSPATSKQIIGRGPKAYPSHAASSLRILSPFNAQAEPTNQAMLPVLTDVHLDGKLDSLFPISCGKTQQGITTANISLENSEQQGRSWYSQGSADRQSSGWQEGLLEGITLPQLARVEGSGKSVSGYFNISQVKYEDTSDLIRTTGLRHLTSAMNRWTMIETKVLPDPISLDEKEIFRVPLIYIASRKAFAFSHKERQNLRDYLYNGGFLLFSDISEEQIPDGPVANSIQFELWKILGDDYNLQPITPKHPPCISFFDFSKDLPIKMNNRQTGLFGISLTNRLAVLYDAVGYGLAWAKDREKNEQALKFGVNIIVYALTVK